MSVFGVSAMQGMGSATGALPVGVAQSGLNIFGSWLSNKWAKEREAIARKENFEYGEMAADASDQRTRDLYYSLYSPYAQMKQIKEAGLSPSMFYGDMAGISGQSGAMGAGATGISPTTFGVTPVELSQIALNNAQANKANAEAKQVEPIANASVSSMLAEAGYKEAAAQAAKAQTAGIELDNYVKDNIKEASIYAICEKANTAAYESEKTYYEMKDAQLLNELNQETLEDKKKIMHAQLESIVQSIAESKSLVKLNEQQRKFLKDTILNNISETELHWAEYELNVQQFETFLEKQIPILEKTLEKELKELDIKQKKLVIDAVTESFKSLAMGAVAASNFMSGGANKGNLSPKPQDMMKPVKPRSKNDVPIYKTNTVWSY